MINLKLHGILGEKFGGEWKINAKTPGEALKAVYANRKDFKTFLLSNPNVFYKIIIGNKNLKNRTEFYKRAKENINVDIVPVLIGSGNFGNILQIVVGAALVIGGAFLMATPFAPVGAAMIIGGLGLLATGVLGLLTPMPKFDAGEQGSLRESFSIGSIPSTINQGDPVPVLYGERIIPGLMIQSLLTTEDA